MAGRELGLGVAGLAGLAANAVRASFLDASKEALLGEIASGRARIAAGAVIGWATDDNYKTPLIEKAIEMAAPNHPNHKSAVRKAQCRPRSFSNSYRPNSEDIFHVDTPPEDPQ